MTDDRSLAGWARVIEKSGEEARSRAADPADVTQEQKLLDELAVAYMEKHGAVAVRDNHDGTMDFIPDDGHVYVLTARRKYPERDEHEDQVLAEIPSCGRCHTRHYPWRPCPGVTS